MQQIDSADYLKAVKKAEQSENVDCVVRISGLPFPVRKQYIANLFKGKFTDFFFRIIQRCSGDLLLTFSS